jgi:hypothetical protein
MTPSVTPPSDAKPSFWDMLTPKTALLFVLPYLYALSVCYNLGFWGLFPVHPYEYYVLTELVKGVMSPLIPSLTAAVILLSGLISLHNLLCWLERRIQQLKEKGKRAQNDWRSSKTLILLLAILSYAVFTVICNWLCIHFLAMRAGFGPQFGPSLFNESREEIRKYYLETASWYLIIFLIPLILRVWKSHMYQAYTKANIAQASSLLFLLFLLGRTYLTGKEIALLAKYDIVYNYVVTNDSDTGRKARFKYLGKAGDYQMLLSIDNQRFTIAPASKFDALTISTFVENEPASVRQAHKYDSLLTLAAKDPIKIK